MVRRMRRGGEEFLGIGVLRVLENLADRASLDDLALGHHCHAVSNFAHDREVVGDEQHGHAIPALQALQEIKNLRLHRHVERRGRFVSDQQFGIIRQRHGDHDALALPA
jgi:hypothetical protein